MSTTTSTPRVRPGHGRLAAPATALAGLLVTVLVAVLAGVMAVASPAAAVAAIAVVAVGVVVWARPYTAAYLVLAITPLVAGIDRGTLLPVLRPNEALVLLVSGVLIVRALVRLQPGQRIHIRLNQIEVALVVMALCASVVPLTWMAVRGRATSGDDISYALVLWKYLAVYALVRLVVRTDDQVRRCLQISIAAAVLVACIGILQVQGLFGVAGLLSTHYAGFGASDATVTRGGSTLSLPAATADLYMLNLALVVALWVKEHRHADLLLPAAGLLVIGTIGAAEFSSLVGLGFAIIVITLVVRRRELFRYFAVAFIAGLIIMEPLISARLRGFESVSGWPVSWTTRLYNLQTYFWPELFSGSNVLLGVRPSARVEVHTQRAGYVWIESGYTWLLWGGGIPLLLAFLYLVYRGMRTWWPRARRLADSRDVAAVGAVVGLAVVALLMIFDPHLTYRGSADLLFSLFALASVTGAGDRNATSGITHVSARPGSRHPVAQPEHDMVKRGIS